MGGIISCFLSSARAICSDINFRPSNSASSVLAYFGGKAKYICYLESNLDAFLSELDKLIRIKQDLLTDVAVAEQRPRRRRTSRVEGWIQSVEQVETEAAKVRQLRDQEIDRLCLGGLCSKDLISSYQFGARVAKLNQDVIMLMVERREEVGEVAVEVPEDAAVALAMDQPGLVGQELLDKVWRCVQEDDAQVRVIGLYGKGGVGKTTLLKGLNNKFSRMKHNFDVVIWSVVSHKPNLNQIQMDIGKRIGLSGESWDRKKFKERAGDICNILSKKKFALLLDDIWDKNPIELTELGVPLQTSVGAASKVVFTTRSYDVCGRMQANNEFEVSSLAHDEAWTLFQEVVGRNFLNSHCDIVKVAESFARECCGLPLALVTLGRTMASKKTLEEWENATISLQKLEDEFSDMKDKVYARLKYSYDNLPNEKIKSCLLYCSLFPEDYRIAKKILVNYWVSEGLAADIRIGSRNIYHLLHACLLEEEDDGSDYVKMHDVIRDMAIWIACKVEEEKFLVQAGVGLTEAPRFEHWKGVQRISLMKNKIKNLSEILNCPSLVTLFLEANQILHITEGFFGQMPSLRVLSLSRNSSLTKLPSGVSFLVSLQHLDLSYNDSIRELPRELKALVSLRYLNLEYTFELCRIPQQLVSSYLKLQVLKMLRCGSHRSRPIVEEGNVLSDGGEQLIKELLCLEDLKLISLTFKSSQAVRFFFKLPRLLSITESLYIRSCKIPIFKDLHGVAFPSLHFVSIDSCPTVKDLTWLVYAPSLQGIEIDRCYDMEQIISVDKLREVSDMVGELNLFAKLKYLRLCDMESLSSIYLNPLPFPQLKEIGVRFCPKLKKLPLNSSSCSEKESKITIRGGTGWWEELLWEDQATENAFSTCFMTLYS